MTPELIGLAFIGLLLILIVLRVPIGVAMGITAIAGITAIRGSLIAGVGLLAPIAFDVGSSVAIMVLPLFLLMGMFSLYGGISEQAYLALNNWLGRLPGGLSIATTWACVAFGATSGSSIAAASIFTKIGLPEMKRQGYDIDFACGGTATAAGIAMLIPPSLFMIIYAMLAEQSLAKMLMAGILPGLVMAVALSINIWIEVIRKPQLAPIVSVSVPWRERLASTARAWPIGLLIVIIIGGIYSGIFNPTEASAVGATAALAISLGYRRLNWKALRSSLAEAVQLTAMIALILIGAFLFNSFIVVTGLASVVGEFIIELGLAPMAYVATIALLFLFLGTFMDSMAAMSIALPVFLPAALAMGIDPIYFGVVIVVAANIGGITPPFGIIVFATKTAAGPGVTSEGIFKGCLRYYPAMLATVAAVVAFPVLSLLIPRAM